MSAKIKNTFKKASKFFQTKKFFSKKFLMVSLAAVVVIAGTSIPAHYVQAWEIGDLLKIDIAGSIADAVAGLFTSDSKLIGFIYGIGIAILSVFLNLVSYYTYLGAWFVDAMLQESIYRDVLGSSAVTTGWTTVRDMCNTFFIFFLLLIAFATILRIQHFGSTKKLLINFIISIFLINFSMVIAKIIIDIGQVFMYEIASWMGSFQGRGISLTSIVDELKDQVNIGQSGFTQFTKAVFALVYAFMLAIAYFMLAGFLLIRLIMFAVLIIISPFAFLSLILPSMKTHTNKWFTDLVNQSLLGPVFLFFVYLSATMANELVNNNYVAGTASLGRDLSGTEEIITTIIPNVIALAMLYAVIPVSKKLSSEGSSILIGGTAGFGKVMMGTYGAIKLSGGFGKKVGAPVARRTGLTDRYRTAKSRTLQKVSENKLAQNVGLGKMAVQINAADFKQQRAEVDKNKAWIKQGSTESRWAALQESRGKSSAEIAANIETMIEKKEINKEDAKAHGIEDKKLDDILIRAKPAIDADKLKESMPHWAAITELGPSKDKEAIDERTVKITTELVSEGKLGSLNKAAKQDPTVINAIRAEHDDFDGWAGSQSKTDKEAIAIGLEGGLQDISEALKGSGKDINTVDGTAVIAGKEGKEWRKEIDSIQKSLAKNDENGHFMLNRPEIDAAGEIRIVNGRIDFAGAPIPGAGTPEYVAWEGRRKKFTEGMKGEKTFKNKSKEFYEEMGQYLAKAQLDTLRKAGNTEQMKAAKQSILAPGSIASAEIRDYVNRNDYYEDL